MSATRRTGATSLATLAAFAAAFVSVHVIAPQWAQSAGLDFWQLPGEVDKCESEQERERELEAIQDRLSQQIAASEATATAFIERRITFSTAVDQILEINSDRSGFEEALHANFRTGKTHRDRVGSYLLAKVESRLADDPTRRAEVLARVQGSR